MIDPTNIVTQFGKTGAECRGSGGNVLDFPAWYEYLELGDTCIPAINNINDIWLILAALIEILTRLGALFAVGFIIWGSIKMVTSQGSPDGIKAARDTITNAIIGLIVAIMATLVVSFIAGQFN